MSETDPVGAPYHPTAGEVGLRRQEPGTATPESAGPSLNVPQVHAPPKPYVKPVVSHGRGDPLAGLSETPARAAAGHPPQVSAAHGGAEAPPSRRHRPSEEELLRDEIVRTREELGRTVEALAQKVDVKARAQQKMVETKAAAKEKAAEVAERLRGAAAHSAVSAREGAPGMLKGVAGRVSAEARRRPGLLVAVGAVTVAGAGWLTWSDRHSGADAARLLRRGRSRGK
ncbi:DUF3618 domain-containing protein [Sphaerisporangium fuscum]|uniref:DUF3618 domain-containing protein n=1 Tax=Sphaerisporangium fuscum TaxID=2835868 RepID=UPI001BDBD91B|nr:DUF3618 domain-containing protein [Sphaerisporangium fuscum]